MWCLPLQFNLNGSRVAVSTMFTATTGLKTGALVSSFPMTSDFIWASVCWCLVESMWSYLPEHNNELYSRKDIFEIIFQLPRTEKPNLTLHDWQHDEVELDALILRWLHSQKLMIRWLRWIRSQCLLYGQTHLFSNGPLKWNFI